MCCQVLLRCLMLCAQAVPAVQLAEGVLAHCYGCMHIQLRLGCPGPHCVFVCARGSHPARCAALWALGAAVPLLPVYWLLAPAVSFPALCASTTAGPVCVADLTPILCCSGVRCWLPACRRFPCICLPLELPFYRLPFFTLVFQLLYGVRAPSTLSECSVGCHGPVCGPAVPGRLFVDCTCVFRTTTRVVFAETVWVLVGHVAETVWVLGHSASSWDSLRLPYLCLPYRFLRDAAGAPSQCSLLLAVACVLVVYVRHTRSSMRT